MEREIRALFDEKTITVYQAYNKTIAESAVKEQKFVSPPFKMERMTWIKPSFLWMMYRSGWAQKENQEHVLAIKIKREGFEWALRNSCLSHYNKDIHISHEQWKITMQDSPVRLQWDPEKNILLQPLPYRSIQIGLSGIAVEKYVNEWIVSIEDISSKCHFINSLIIGGKLSEAERLLPVEVIYSVANDLAKHIQISNK